MKHYKADAYLLHIYNTTCFKKKIILRMPIVNHQDTRLSIEREQKYFFQFQEIFNEIVIEIEINEKRTVIRDLKS